MNLGATHVGAVDLLVRALYVPDVEGENGDFSIKATDGNLKLGYGVRVGVLDATNLVVYRAHGGYTALARAIGSTSSSCN